MSSLEALGWCDHFAEQQTPGGTLLPARVVQEQRTGFRVQTEESELPARIAGALRHGAVDRNDLPAVGDWVELSWSPQQTEAVIERVLPRKTKFSRKVAGAKTEEQIVAANIDWVWIVCALDNDFNLRRIERYLALAWESGAGPVVLLTKSDLHEDASDYLDQLDDVALRTPVHTLSSKTGDGVEQLSQYLRGNSTVTLLGSSGVGKSTLVNRLAGRTLQETGEIRDDGKGRHTTTYRQLLQLPGGGLLIDTPGMRELQLWESEAGMSETFEEIDRLAEQCRFSDCQHQGEPGCAVQAGIEAGEITEERLQSFLKLQRELAYLDRKQDGRARQLEKQRIKSIMKSVRKHPKYKHR